MHVSWVGRRTILAAAALLVAAAGLSAVASIQDAVKNPVLYTETRTSGSTFRDRGGSYAPTYLVYADKQRTADEARQLIDDLGMTRHLDEYKARAFVVGPTNGTAYDPAGDLEAFKNLLRTRRSSNLKIIGIGAGATFVNNVIAKYAFAVAGILTYGGAVDVGVTSSIPVPAYVHASNPAVAKLFVAANGATRKLEETAAFTAYTNPGPHAELQRVVVSKLPDAKETLPQAFENAWKTVFSRIKVVALDPYGHWNFKPAAEDMWAFLSRFRRDTMTGRLLVTPAR